LTEQAGAENGDDAAMPSIPLAAAALAAICLAPVWLMPGTARADAAAGARMALQWCANCHVVNAAGSGPSGPIPQGPPAFATIAGHLTPDRLRSFLSHPHGAMPDLALSRAEINDLIDYIQTLQ
jgi:mono/diheme cytochrome c family protein